MKPGPPRGTGHQNENPNPPGLQVAKSRDRIFRVPRSLGPVLTATLPVDAVDEECLTAHHDPLICLLSRDGDALDVLEVFATHRHWTVFDNRNITMKELCPTTTKFIGGQIVSRQELFKSVIKEMKAGKPRQ